MNWYNKIIFSIDDFLFKQISNFKSTTTYQQIQNSIAGLNEKQKKIINRIFSYALILSPILVAFFFWLLNYFDQSNLEKKEKLLLSMNTLVNNKKDFDRDLPFPSVLENEKTKEEFESKINKVLGAKKEPSAAIAIDDFIDSPLGDHLVEYNTKISFNGLNLSDFNTLFINLIRQEKALIKQVSIQTNEINKTLEGQVEIVQVAKKNRIEGDEYEEGDPMSDDQFGSNKNKEESL